MFSRRNIDAIRPIDLEGGLEGMGGGMGGLGGGLAGGLGGGLGGLGGLGGGMGGGMGGLGGGMGGMGGMVPHRRKWEDMDMLDKVAHGADAANRVGNAIGIAGGAASKWLAALQLAHNLYYDGLDRSGVRKSALEIAQHEHAFKIDNMVAGQMAEIEKRFLAGQMNARTYARMMHALIDRLNGVWPAEVLEQWKLDYQIPSPEQVVLARDYLKMQFGKRTKKYQSNRVYFGKRGGTYIMNKGKKQYIIP